VGTRYLDQNVVFDNLCDGILNVDQACALLLTQKEAARYFLTNRLSEILRALNKDEDEPTADGDPFGQIATLKSLRASLHKLHPNLQAGGTLLDLDSPAGRALEVFWKLFGPFDSINLFHLEDGPLVQSFFKQKLHNALDQFTDDDLIRLSDAYRADPTMQRIVLNARGRCLIPIANQLLRNPAEINRDLAEVKNRISAYCFTPELNEVLDKVEDELAAGGDAFDQAALLKHLRTFFETLHAQAGLRLRSQKPETVDGADLAKFGQAIDYLHRHGVLTEKMRDFAKALYGVLSNEGVHALKSEREYVRLCRNQVAEYALVLLFELERRLRA
jgi:hypothetical protein